MRKIHIPFEVVSFWTPKGDCVAKIKTTLKVKWKTGGREVDWISNSHTISIRKVRLKMLLPLFYKHVLIESGYGWTVLTWDDIRR